MGSGDWFKAIVGKKKSKLLKGSESQKANGNKRKNKKFFKSNSTGSSNNNGIAIEELAAIRIQMAFRRYKARKTLRCLRGTKRLRGIAQGNTVQKQASTTLEYIQSWNRIQAEIRNRRAFMVTEGRNRQKKQESQMKLEAKLHDLEVEWCGGTESMEEILARIQQREEAAVKRERTMAYAFSHQWRAKPGLNLGPFVYETGKSIWGWSWIDRWIAARPWEPRVPINPTNPKKGPPKVGSKVSGNAIQPVVSVSSSNNSTPIDGKGSTTKPKPTQSNEKKEIKESKAKEVITSSSKLKTKGTKLDKK